MQYLDIYSPALRQVHRPVGLIRCSVNFRHADGCDSEGLAGIGIAAILESAYEHSVGLGRILF